VNTTILAHWKSDSFALWTDDARRLKKTLDEISQSFRLALTDRIFSQDGSSLEEVVANILTMTTHDSARSSRRAARAAPDKHRRNLSYFLGEWSATGNELKTTWADVPRRSSNRKAPVSSEVAMPWPTLRRRAGAPRVGITGIAGPSGG